MMKQVLTIAIVTIVTMAIVNRVPQIKALVG